MKTFIGTILIMSLFAPSFYIIASELLELLRSRRASISTEKCLKAKRERREAQKKLVSNWFNELVEDGRLQRVCRIDSIRKDNKWLNINYVTYEALSFFELKKDGTKYWSVDAKEWYKLK